jgi:HK97 family phage portal protein
MGFLDRFFKRSASVAVPVSIGNGNWAYYYAGAGTAEKVAAVYSCVKLISESVASIPLELKRYDPAGKYFRNDYGNPLYTLLAEQPNSRQTSFEFIRSIVVRMLVDGNAYVYPRRNAFGDVAELLLLQGVSYNVKDNVYRVIDTVNGIDEVLMPYEIIHLRNLGLRDDYEGVPTIRQAATAIGLSASADGELSNLFKNGSRYRGFITGKSGAGASLIGAHQDKALEETRNKILTDLASGANIVCLPEDTDFKALSMTPQDLQLLENKKFTVKEIGRYFRVHPSMLYEDGGSTYSNAEMDAVTFQNNTLLPILRHIELELACKLIHPDERGRYRIKFDQDEMYTTDLSTKANYMKATIEAGVYTINDWRHKEGNPPVEGGDVAMCSANLVTVGSRVAEAQKLENENNGDGN